jgi:hypothetical protein
MLANVSGFEEIVTYGGAQTLTLDAGFGARNPGALKIDSREAGGGKLFVNGYDDVVDARPGNNVSVIAGYGSDTLRTGAGNDRFIFQTSSGSSARDLDGDVVSGGSGTDTIFLGMPSAPKALRNDGFANVTGIERIEQGKTDNYIVLPRADWATTRIWLTTAPIW